MTNLLRYIIVALVLMSSAIVGHTSDLKLHVVIFGDTNDPSIGQAVITDVSLFENLAKEIERVLSSEGVKIISYKHVGGDCSPQGLNGFVENFSCQDDIVLFYYNGHGGRSHKDSSKFPRMCLGSNYADEWVKVSDLIQKIKKKKPRLQVIITDCCNSYYDRRTTQDYRLSTLKGNGSGYKRLFLKTTGDVSITAASPGEYGWCTPSGSYMTLCVIDVLQYMDTQGDNANWQSMLKMVSDNTYKATKELYDNRVIGNSQRPVYDVNEEYCGDENTPPINDDVSDNNNEIDIEVDERADDGDDSIGGQQDDGDINNRIRNDSDDEICIERGSSFGIGTLVIMALGLMLIVKLPSWLNLTGVLSVIVRCIGILLIVYTLLEALY